ncbi:MAG: FCD domain-containing protein [Geminicoccaceae bacterium]
MDLSGALPGEPADLERMMAAILERYRETGELPPERQLRDELAVTRHRLRAALGRLRAEGRLPPARTGRRPASAPRVEGSDFFARLANPLELMELRLIIEPTLARLTALRASSLEIARVVKLATTPPGSPSAAADIAFHRAVAQASRNTLAGEIYGLLRRIGTDQRIRVAGSETSCPCASASATASTSGSRQPLPRATAPPPSRRCASISWPSSAASSSAPPPAAPSPEPVLMLFGAFHR